jgi:hypothetical protein
LVRHPALFQFQNSSAFFAFYFFLLLQAFNFLPFSSMAATITARLHQGQDRQIIVRAKTLDEVLSHLIQEFHIHSIARLQDQLGAHVEDLELIQDWESEDSLEIIPVFDPVQLWGAFSPDDISYFASRKVRVEPTLPAYQALLAQSIAVKTLAQTILQPHVSLQETDKLEQILLDTFAGNEVRVYWMNWMDGFGMVKTVLRLHFDEFELEFSTKNANVSQPQTQTQTQTQEQMPQTPQRPSTPPPSSSPVIEFATPLALHPQPLSQSTILTPEMTSVTPCLPTTSTTTPITPVVPATPTSAAGTPSALDEDTRMRTHVYAVIRFLGKLKTPFNHPTLSPEEVAKILRKQAANFELLKRMYSSAVMVRLDERGKVMELDDEDATDVGTELMDVLDC